jgi:hypothetical protein
VAERIQRRRAKGWRMPEGAVVVDRSTPWGNPFIVGKDGTRDRVVKLFRLLVAGYVCVTCKPALDELMEYRRRLVEHLAELRGKDLACWCPLGQPCHADVLLEAANG